eukprot:1715-Heterococcus_DN1.PRE.2
MLFLLAYDSAALGSTSPGMSHCNVHITKRCKRSVPCHYSIINQRLASMSSAAVTTTTQGNTMLCKVQALTPCTLEKSRVISTAICVYTLLPQIMPTQAGSALASKFLRHTSSESNDASLVTSYTSIAPCQCVDTREVCIQALSAPVALMHA